MLATPSSSGFPRVRIAIAAALTCTAVASVRPAAAQGTAAPAAAVAGPVTYAYTAADVRFMTMMIGHHGQAVTMSRLAPTHGASPAVRRLADRIINAQQDEIRTMQQWLRERGQPVPPGPTPDAPAATPMAGMAMGDMPMHDMRTHDMPTSGSPARDTAAAHGDHHAMLMPGMLTDAQMAQLGRARGTEFDRLFLTFMIQHHRGAVGMVDDLFASYGAGQDETVFKFASDVHVDQTTEIARMQQMLAAIVLGDS